MSKVEEMRKWATKMHDIRANQKYGSRPYSFHLKMVEDFCEKFKHLYKGDYDQALICAWGHDLIEDARITYNDVKGKFGEEVAEIIFKLTEYKGRTRQERHPDKYYEIIANDPTALYVKLCDICANFTHSAEIKGNMYMRYRKELPRVRELLYRENYKEIFEYLDSLQTESNLTDLSKQAQELNLGY